MRRTIIVAYTTEMLLDTACFCSKVRRSSRRLMRLYDDALAPADLTVMQFAAMRAIVRLQRPGLTQLAEATGVERSAMWRTLQPLVGAGLVTMGGTPRKATQIEVTDEGQSRLEKATPFWRAVQDRVDAALGDQAENLFAALDRLERIDA